MLEFYSPVPLFFAATFFVVLAVALWLTRFRSYYLLLPATAFLLASLEDLYMTTNHPEAMIRTDLVLFLGLIVITTPLGVVLTFLHRWPADGAPGTAEGSR